MRVIDNRDIILPSSTLGHTKLIICFWSTVRVIFTYYTDTVNYSVNIIQLSLFTNLSVCAVNITRWC